MKLKLRLFKVLERSVAGDFISKITDIFLVVLILVNAAVVILETVQSVYEEYRLFLTSSSSFPASFFPSNISCACGSAPWKSVLKGLSD